MANFMTLTYVDADGVATITINRPERRNALNPDTINELIYALELARDDAAVRVVVLTGAGTVFCAGGDLASMGQKKPADYDVPQRGGFVELNLALRELGKPSIARVNGHAMGGGLGLALACDFTVASETAKFGTPEIDVGLFPMMIMAQIFRCVPKKRGLKMVLLGERLSAGEALEIGMATQVVAPEALDQAVGELARALASKSPITLKLGLEAYNRQAEMDFASALPYLEQMLGKCLATEDFKEGISAFLQKRAPQWKGR